MELWWKASRGLDQLDEIDRARYFNLLTWWLTLHENIYHQWRNKLIDQETFRSWTRDLEYYAQAQQLGNHWPQLKGYFESSFAQHVMTIIVRQAKKRE